MKRTVVKNKINNVSFHHNNYTGKERLGKSAWYIYSWTCAFALLVSTGILFLGIAKKGSKK